jgi:hypothetical protein
LVKARNGGRWIKLTEGVDESRVGAGYQARVAGLSDNAKVVDVAWLDGERLERELPEHDFVQIAFGKDSADVRIECCVHDAPSGQQFRFKTAESAEFGAVRDAGGHTWARVSDLPEEIRRDPSLLSTEPRLAGEDLRLAQALEEGEFAQAGSQLARDPALYNERLERILTSDLRENDRLIALRQWSLANEQLRAAISIHGRLPELTYRQALLEAVADRPAGIASALNNSFPRPIADADRFFSQLNESLANAPSPAVKENLAKIGDFADWNAKASKSGDVFVIGDNGRAELALNLDRVPAGRVLDGSEVSSIFAQNRPAVYVASEHPELRSLDPFTPAGQRSLTQLVASKRVTLRELQMSDVAHYRPALVVPRGADSSFQWHIAHGAERTLSEAGRYVRAQSNGCDSDKDPNCRVYVIEGRNGQ